MNTEDNEKKDPDEKDKQRSFWDLRGHIEDSGQQVAGALDERFKETGFALVTEADDRFRKAGEELLNTFDGHAAGQRKNLVDDFEGACTRQREAFFKDVDQQAQKVLADIDEKLTRRADEEVNTALKLFGIMACTVAMAGAISLLFAWLQKGI